ncbi:MAG: TolC family protein [Candidatus Hydrogenedentes bacterium]|nr:TolC family protein [Candidatus Hydrogenedentota bacterium]
MFLRRFGMIVLAAVPGCALHVAEFEPRPAFDVPESYTLPAPEASIVVAPWWHVFEDPALNTAMEQALAGNLTLAQGRDRILRAAALLRQHQAALLPQVDFDSEGAQVWEKNLDLDTSPEPEPDGFTPPSNTEDDPAADDAAKQSSRDSSGTGSESGAGANSGSNQSIDNTSWETEFSAGISLSWELDFWGRLRSLAGAQAETLGATTEEYEALRLSLSMDLADTWFAAVEQRMQLDLLDEQLELAETFLELIELRFLQGDASIVDVLQQRSQVAEIEAEVPVAQSQLRLLENRIDVLAGIPPDGVDRTADAIQTLPQNTRLPEISVPLDLLLQRPDLRALQRRAVAVDYQIGAAIAERLPRVTLNGSFAYSDGSSDATLTGIGGLGLFQPLLDWGARKAAVDATRAVYSETLHQFSEQYLEAIEEVETTLWQEGRQRELLDALARRAEILDRTVEETRVRYSLGVTDYLPVLTALQDLQEIQRDLIDERRALVSLRIRLFGAVGAPTAAPKEGAISAAATVAGSGGA